MVDITIVIISYNTKDLLRNCLGTVYSNCSDVRVEVFVVDNASTDGSPEMVSKEFPQTILIRNDENVGFAAANNQAIRIANGRYVLLLNSDTLILGDVLTNSMAYLDNHQDVAVMGCRVLNPDRTVQYTCASQPSVLASLLKITGLHRRRGWFGQEHYRDWERDSERDVGVVTGCYMLVCRSGIEQVGVLDERFFFNYEETDWCLRFQKSGWRTTFAPVGEIIHYGGASSGPQNPVREVHLIRGKVQFFTKHRGPLVGIVIWFLTLLFWLTRAGMAHVAWLTNCGAMGEKRALAIHVLSGFPKLRPCLVVSEPHLNSEKDASVER